jgi:hypothetical protein
MADSWEILHFGNTAASGGGSDGDGDGINDLGEYIGGTVPGQGTSLTEIRSIHANGTTRIVLPTLPAAGTGYTRLERRYTLESTPRLDIPFSPLPGFADRLGEGTPLVYSNLTGEVRYFRGSAELR